MKSGLRSRESAVVESESSQHGLSSDGLSPDGVSSDVGVITVAALQFTSEAGANSSIPTYQEASGAPVEVISPLGYKVGPITVIFLNLGKLIGTGIFTTPSYVLEGSGSPGLALIYWFVGFLVASSMLAIYLEFAAYFPSRSGSDVVYLEQSYPRPRYLVPTVFAMQTVLFCFSSVNAIVLAEYLFKLAESEPTPWQLKGVAVAGYTVAVLVLVFDTKWSLRFCNVVALIKFLTLIFIAITGLAVLGGHVQAIPDPTRNFRNAFAGSASVYGTTTAIMKVIFAYDGYDSAFTVVNEVRNPAKTLRWTAPLSLLIIGILYILANIAYFAAASREEILEAKIGVASLFFEKVFGTSGAPRALNFLICVSAFGNLVVVLIGKSRILRECGRQGVLPFTEFWASVRPFGTPLGPYFVKWAMTVLMILIPPAGDAFNFIVDLSTYPSSAFYVLLALGLLLTRHHRKGLRLPKPAWYAWDGAVYFAILANTYLLVAPWVPPTTGSTGGDVSFWYATYIVVGLGLLGVCAAYYYVYIRVLPRLGGYDFRQVIIKLDGGEVSHKLIKVPVSELEAWDEEHDAAGRLRRRAVLVDTVS